MGNLDLTQFALAVTVIIGLVNIAQFGFNRNYKALAFAGIAVAAGTLFGFLHWYGIPSTELGLAIGVSSSGVYKIAQII